MTTWMSSLPFFTNIQICGYIYSITLLTPINFIYFSSLIATPGRLLHIVVEMGLKLSSVQYVVFDEADRLFEIGLADQLKEIIKRLPESRQTLLFSATLPKILVDFAKAGLSDPILGIF